MLKFLSIVDGGLLLNDLATDQVTYEIEVEKLILNSLNNILEENVPQIVKEEKSLDKNLNNFDAAKVILSNHRTKLENVTESATNYNEQIEREEKLANELEDLETRLNHSRESVYLLMLQFLSKESDVGELLLRYFELKRDYHASVAERISKQINAFQESLNGKLVIYV